MAGGGGGRTGWHNSLGGDNASNGTFAANAAGGASNSYTTGDGAGGFGGGWGISGANGSNGRSSTVSANVGGFGGRPGAAWQGNVVIETSGTILGPNFAVNAAAIPSIVGVSNNVGSAVANVTITVVAGAANGNYVIFAGGRGSDGATYYPVAGIGAGNSTVGSSAANWYSFDTSQKNLRTSYDTTGTMLTASRRVVDGNEPASYFFKASGVGAVSGVVALVKDATALTGVQLFDAAPYRTAANTMRETFISNTNELHVIMVSGSVGGSGNVSILSTSGFDGTFNVANSANHSPVFVGYKQTTTAAAYTVSIVSSNVISLVEPSYFWKHYVFVNDALGSNTIGFPSAYTGGLYQRLYGAGSNGNFCFIAGAANGAVDSIKSFIEASNSTVNSVSNTIAQYNTLELNGYFLSNNAGNYNFFANAGGQSNVTCAVYIGNNALYYGSFVSSNTLTTTLSSVGTVTLAATTYYPIKIVYSNVNGTARLVGLRFNGPSISNTDVGNNYFFSRSGNNSFFGY